MFGSGDTDGEGVELQESQVDHQGAFEPFQRPQLQGFHPATRFQDAEENFHPPAAAIPVNQFDHRVQGFGGPLGEQPPFDGLFTGGWLFFTGQDRGNS